MNRLNPICSICRDDLHDGNESNATECGHIFHRACIRLHLHKFVHLSCKLSLEGTPLANTEIIFVCMKYHFSKPICPVCNKNVNRRNLLKLFFSTTDLTNTTTSNVTMANATSANVTSAQTGAAAVASTSSNHPTQPQRITRHRATAANVTSTQTTSPIAATASSDRPSQPQRIARRRPTQHFNYKKINCLFCHSIFTTVSDYVVCDSCLHKN